MATPPYVPLDPNKPDGATQGPADYATADLSNVRALRDAVVCGYAPGYSYATSGGADYLAPEYRTWTQVAGPLRFRLRQLAAVPSYYYIPAQVQWQWSNDSGATWVNMGAAINLTWEGVGAGFAAITAVSGDAGLWLLALHAMGFATRAGVHVNAHELLIGPAAHGLGTMSTQNANAVNVAGGTVANTTWNGGLLTNVPRIYPVAPPTLLNGMDWNWTNQSGVQWNSAPGITWTLTGGVPGEVKRVWVTGPGAVTIIGVGGTAFTWMAGHPVWSAAGGTLINLVRVTSASIIGTTAPA